MKRLSALLLLLIINQIVFSSNGIELNQNVLKSFGYGLENSTTGKTHHINLEEKNIDKIDSNTFENITGQVTDIILSYNNLTHIDLGLFAGVENLTRLSLSNNPLARLTNVNNIVLHHLHSLDLVSTYLSSLDANLIAALPNLTSLDLSYSYNLKPLVANQLAPLTHLTQLFLSANNQKSLHPGIFNGLHSIKWIYFESSNISAIEPNTFADLTHLEFIDLSHNALTTLNGLKVPKSLLEFKCVRNKLTSLIFDGRNGTLGIRKLDLSNNQFTTFKWVNFRLMPNLVELELSSNPISDPNEIYLQIQPIPNITWLCLRELGIRSINSNFFKNFPKLKMIDLKSNRISSIEAEAFSGLQNLTHIYLTNNSLTHLDSSTFSGLSSSQIHKIHLGHNKISQLDSGTFDELQTLSILILDDNELTSLEKTIFLGCYNLVHLHLADNKIAHIAPGTFNSQAKLEELILSFNKLTYLDGSIFAQCSKLETIYLYENPALPKTDIQTICPTSECQVYF